MAKNFKDQLPTVNPANPALQFISEANPEPESAPPATQPADTNTEMIVSSKEIAAILKIYLRDNPQYMEKRTIRLQLVISPSLKEEMTATAQKQGISNNELVNRAIKEYVERNNSDG